MKQSYHSYLRRVNCIWSTAGHMQMAMLIERRYTPEGIELIRSRQDRLLKQARRNFEARRKGA